MKTFFRASLSFLSATGREYIRCHGSNEENPRDFNDIDRKLFTHNFASRKEGTSGPQAQVGDDIRAFKGACFALALRKDGIRDSYRLYGEAYIHGILGPGIYEEGSATPEMVKIN